MRSFFQSSYGRIVYTDTHPNVPGETLLMVHGLPTAKELFTPVLPHLSPLFRVITFDLNDYGESDKLHQFTSKKTGMGMTHQQRADVLDELRAHLRLEQFVLVTHDLGSSVGIDYMGQYASHVQKLIILSPPVYPDFQEPAIVKLVRIPYLGELLVLIARNLLLDLGIKRGLTHKERFTPELRTALHQAFAGAEGRAALLRNLRWGRPRVFFKDYPAIIKSIQVPTLIIQGKQDPYIPHAQVLRLHYNISHSRLRFIENGSHFLPIDTPEQVAQAINQFLLS